MLRKFARPWLMMGGFALGLQACDGNPPAATGAADAPAVIYADEHAYVGFNQTTTDAEVANLLRDHAAKVRAVHVWVAGFSGTHRVDEPGEAAGVIAEARQALAAQFQNSLKANTIRLQQFTTQHKETDVLANTTLTEQLRALLGLRANFQDAISHLASGEPIVLSAEIKANKADLDRMEETGGAPILNRATDDPLARRAARPERPAKYQIDYHSKSMPLDTHGQDLWLRAKAIAIPVGKALPR